MTETAALLNLVQMFARSTEADSALRDALSKLNDNVTEQNGALADVVEALEKAGKDKGAALDPEAFGRSLVAALVVAIKSMPAPIVNVDMPDTPERKDWTSLTVKTPKGENYVITRN